MSLYKGQSFIIDTTRILQDAFNMLRPRQNGHHFPDDILKWIFLNVNIWVSIKISLEFVPESPINNIPTLCQIMAWHRASDKPLSEPMMVNLLMNICVTRPQWVKYQWQINIRNERHETSNIRHPWFWQLWLTLWCLVLAMIWSVLIPCLNQRQHIIISYKYIRNKLDENSDQKNFLQHNSFEKTVCEMTDIFSGVRGLTTSLLSTTFAGMNSL